MFRLSTDGAIDEFVAPDLLFHGSDERAATVDQPLAGPELTRLEAARRLELRDGEPRAAVAAYQRIVRPHAEVPEVPPRKRSDDDSGRGIPRWLADGGPIPRGRLADLVRSLIDRPDVVVLKTSRPVWAVSVRRSPPVVQPSTIVWTSVRW